MPLFILHTVHISKPVAQIYTRTQCEERKKQFTQTYECGSEHNAHPNQSYVNAQIRWFLHVCIYVLWTLSLIVCALFNKSDFSQSHL